MLYAILRFIQLNIRIIFGNKFTYFLAGAFGFFILSICINILSEIEITQDSAYSQLLIPAVLLIFYPTCFGIQNDQDAKMMEIIFGIPNYRYKVWFIRLFIAFFICIIITLLLCILTNELIVYMPPFETTFRLMIPVLFIGFLSFMFSTIIRNGNGAAVIVVIIIFILFIIHQNITTSKWDIFINPYYLPQNTNVDLFQMVLIDNYLIFGISSFICLFIGIYNMQRREKFI